MNKKHNLEEFKVVQKERFILTPVHIFPSNEQKALKRPVSCYKGPNHGGHNNLYDHFIIVMYNRYEMSETEYARQLVYGLPHY